MKSHRQQIKSNFMKSHRQQIKSKPRQGLPFKNLAVSGAVNGTRAEERGAWWVRGGCLVAGSERWRHRAGATDPSRENILKTSQIAFSSSDASAVA
jgi:hypothetical protein